MENPWKPPLISPLNWMGNGLPGLVMTNIANWKNTMLFSWVNPLFLWPCSIAFCMFTREYVVWFIGGTVNLRNSAWISPYFHHDWWVKRSNGQTLPWWTSKYLGFMDVHPQQVKYGSITIQKWALPRVRSRVPDPYQYFRWGIDFRKDGWKCWQHQ